MRERRAQLWAGGVRQSHGAQAKSGPGHRKHGTVPRSSLSFPLALAQRTGGAQDAVISSRSDLLAASHMTV